MDFAALAAEVDHAAPRPGRERVGRPPFPTGVTVRVLLIQQLFNLSDEQMEFQFLDRLSFQRFAGLRASSQIPDRTTIWTFKERLIQAGASESIFDAVKGYVNGKREARLNAEGWRMQSMHIQRKGSKEKPLSEAQERCNRRIAKPRARVEHVFAGLDQLGGKVLRSIGLARATLHLNWKVATYNLRRLYYLKEAKIEPFDAHGPSGMPKLAISMAR